MMGNVDDLPNDSFCGTGFLMDTLRSYEVIGYSLLLGISVIISNIGYLTLKRLANILWYHFMRSVETSGSMADCSGTRLRLLQWLQENVQTKRLPHINIIDASRQEEYGQTTYELKNGPSYETTNYFTYKGHWVFINRHHVVNVVSEKTTWESITLYTFQWNSWVLNEIMDEVLALLNEEPASDDTTRFYLPSDGYWNDCGYGKRKRPLSSVILSTTVLNKVIGDIREFLGAAKWYQDRGIPYRRGYMLFGSPGCGKSSFIKAIAGEINYSICILSLSSKKINDESLNNLMNSTFANCIILLEDVDAAFPNRDADDYNDDDDNDKEKKRKYQTQQESENGSGKVTLSGLLNALDGVASTEGRIVFLTTNHIVRLDSAMMRPGRVDLKVLIDLPDDDQLLRMFVRFYPEANVETDAKEFVRKIRSLKKPKVSMAMVQGLFMMHKYDYKEMMGGIEQYFEEQFFSLTQGKAKELN